MIQELKFKNMSESQTFHSSMMSNDLVMGGQQTKHFWVQKNLQKKRNWCLPNQVTDAPILSHHI